MENSIRQRADKIQNLKQSGGFTFLEVLVTIGILGGLLAVGLPIGWDFSQRYQFDSEAGLFISILESARNSAMVNLRESSHGVYIASDKFVIFQGSSYAFRDASRDRNFSRSGGVVISGPSEIVFAALAGTTTVSAFDISYSQGSVTINVNSEGTIIY